MLLSPGAAEKGTLIDINSSCQSKQAIFLETTPELLVAPMNLKMKQAMPSSKGGHTTLRFQNWRFRKQRPLIIEEVLDLVQLGKGCCSKCNNACCLRCKIEFCFLCHH